MWRKLWGTDNKQNTKGWIDVVLYIHDILLLHKYNIYALYIIKYNVHIYRICVWTIINKEKEPINFRVKVAWKDTSEEPQGGKGKNTSVITIFYLKYT